MMDHATADPSRSPPEAASPTHLLLAEDDDEMRAMLADVLRADGYLVTEVSDGEEMVSKMLELVDAERHPLDVIVSDIRMPGHSGLEVLTLVRSLGLQTPVILVTAFGDLKTHRQAESLGVNAVLDKPFDLDDLRTLLLHFAPPR
jgi:CheY-like chemotaxis protein